MKKKIIILLTLIMSVCFTIAGLTACSENDVYTLVVNGGSGSGRYEAGTTVTIKPIQPDGMLFSEWLFDNGTKSDKAEYKLKIEKDTVVEAVYVNAYTLTVNGAEGSGIYKDGEKVTISANANLGEEVFKHWLKNGQVYSDDLSIEITVDRDATYSAVYTSTCTVTVNNGFGSGLYAIGQEVTVYPDVPADKIFRCWEVDGEFFSDEYNLVFTPNTDSITITAVFENKISLTVTDGIGTGLYVKGSEVTVSATKDEYKKFISWTLNGQVVSEEENYSFILTEDSVLVGNYQDIPARTLTVVGGKGSGVYPEGKTVTVTSEPPKYQTFINWTVDGDVVSTEDPYTFVLEGDTTITANFDEIIAQEDFELQKVLFDSYVVGNVLSVPLANFKSSTTTITAVGPNGVVAIVEGNKLPLNDVGSYTIRWTADKDTSIYEERTINVVENLGYISSSDGAVTNSMAGTKIYANNYNKDATLTVNNIVDVSGARFAGSYLIAQVVFGEGLTDISGMFTNFVIKVTDYNNPANYFTVTLASASFEKMNAYVKHSSSDEAILIEGVYFGGGMNILFDYADKKVAIGAKDNAANITGFEGFTDGRCVVTMYALEWATGVESVNLGFDWVFDNRNYAVSMDDCYTTITQAPEQAKGIPLSRVMLDSYEMGKTLVLPTADAACDVVVADPDGSPVVITDNKLALSKAGVYTVTYTLSSDTGITKVLKIRSVENLSYLSSNDGSVNATSDASYIYANGYKKGTVLTVNKIIDASSASFASAYVIAAPVAK